VLKEFRDRPKKGTEDRRRQNVFYPREAVGRGRSNNQAVLPNNPVLRKRNVKKEKGGEEKNSLWEGVLLIRGFGEETSTAGSPWGGKKGKGLGKVGKRKLAGTHKTWPPMSVMEAKGIVRRGIVIHRSRGRMGKNERRV